jgi:hypothetical protein
MAHAKKTTRTNARKTNSSPKIKKVMREFKEGNLNSGSKKGPRVTTRRQAVAIALSENRKSRSKVSKKKGK